MRHARFLKKLAYVDTLIVQSHLAVLDFLTTPQATLSKDVRLRIGISSPPKYCFRLQRNHQHQFRFYLVFDQVFVHIF